MKKKLFNLLLFFLMLQFVDGQTMGYHYQSAIDSIKDDGFYNIVLTPAINAHLKTDYSDLRIVNDSGKWVPHLLRAPNTEYTNDAVLWDLKIIKKENFINHFSYFFMMELILNNYLITRKFKYQL